MAARFACRLRFRQCRLWLSCRREHPPFECVGSLLEFFFAELGAAVYVLLVSRAGLVGGLPGVDGREDWLVPIRGLSYRVTSLTPFLLARVLGRAGVGDGDHLVRLLFTMSWARRPRTQHTGNRRIDKYPGPTYQDETEKRRAERQDNQRHQEEPVPLHVRPAHVRLVALDFEVSALSGLRSVIRTAPSPRRPITGSCFACKPPLRRVTGPVWVHVAPSWGWASPRSHVPLDIAHNPRGRSRRGRKAAIPCWCRPWRRAGIRSCLAGVRLG